MNAQYHVHSQYTVARASAMERPAREALKTHNINAYVWMFGNGALASCIAEAATLPLEVTKVSSTLVLGRIKLVDWCSWSALLSLKAFNCSLQPRVDRQTCDDLQMRLQLQKNNTDPLKLPRYSGMVDAFKSIVRQEKWFSLFKVSKPN